jgi:hypothetical protein
MFRNGLLGTAAVALFAAGLTVAPKDANAIAYGYSALQITNLKISGLDSGFSSFKFTKKGLNVNLNGNSQSTAASAPISVAGVPLDDAQLCKGACGNFNNNVYFGAPDQPVSPTPGPVGQGSFAVADMHMLNTVIAANPGGKFGTQSGAQFAGGGFGVASTSSSQEMQWNFTLAGNQNISFTWDQQHIIEVVTTLLGETANATLDFAIKIVGRLGTVFSSTDNIFDAGNDLNIIGEDSPFDLANASSGVLVGESSDFGLLDAGKYSLTITFDSSSTVTGVPVPEPGTLGLVGIGLLGLGVVSMRRRRKV